MVLDPYESSGPSETNVDCQGAGTKRRWGEGGEVVLYDFTNRLSMLRRKRALTGVKLK